MQNKQRVKRAQFESRIRCVAKVALLLILLGLGFVAAASAEDKESYFRSVNITDEPYKGSVTCIGCDVVVRGDLHGEIVSLWGDVTVYGKVREGVVAVGGAVHLKNGAEVGEDIVALGGQITREGIVATPANDSTAIPWMHLPGQRSIGWRGAVALLGFHLFCALVPCVFLRPRAVRSVAKASRRWLAVGLLGAAAIVAYSYGMLALDEYLHVSDLVESIFAFIFLVVLGIGLAGIAYAIGDTIFPGKFVTSLLAGAVILTVLELIPYAGFLAMALAASWATGSAIWSGLGFRGPRPPRVPKGLELKLTS
ncbi:MAG: hypothetical protein JSS69_11085 [Acidobacteria bacterium]|nr:hypothetical protein [Acidobacteriota bacterium]MBS1866447.1 hypothetical protein [Acidobacteriota bacterium]